MTAAPRLDELGRDVRSSGLAWRGAFHPGAADAVPPLADGGPAATLVLLGFVGGGEWPAFTASAEHADGRPHPLDRWSRRVTDVLARRHGACALYPSDGPPWLPFQRWAMRAEAVHRSPLGILIHPDYGLWHAYRGALAFAMPLDLPPVAARASPCDGCAARPCLAGCPVGAFAPQGYDVAACIAHLDGGRGADCLAAGCQARRACPVGPAYRPAPEAAAFHMAAFHRSQRRDA